jgi:hypothetical protein
MSWYVFWGILYLCLGLWEMWRQTRADLYWKKGNDWFGEYGRNMQADGRTPTQYALGFGRSMVS